MAYSFDLYGWYAGEVADGSARSTLLEPPTLSTTTTPGEQRANFTGYVWETKAYAEPPANPPAPAAARHITPLAFRNRFTTAEKVAIELAALDSPAAEMSLRQQAAALRASLRDVESATFIDLDKADTRARVQGLESAGVIGEGRALEILDGAIQDSEKA
jgi:hypothetical protein